jgi:cell wall-associated NlpC family hydrolase
MFILPTSERDNPGNAIVTMSVTRLAGCLIVLSIPLAVFMLIITFYSVNIMGQANNPLENRAPGGVAGIPPSSEWSNVQMPQQKDFLLSEAQREGVPWQVVASICFMESEFGRTSNNYCGLADSQWDKYYSIAYPPPSSKPTPSPATRPVTPGAYPRPTQPADSPPVLWPPLPREKNDSEKSIKVLTVLLSQNGMGFSDPGFKNGLAAFREGDLYYYRVLQVAGRYGFILRGSFEDSLIKLASTRLGSPYVWGASGPDNFDCSGLTMWGFAKLGLTLPRNSEAQYFFATPVTENQVMPGDLFFLQQTYPDPNIRITHVGFYLGGGLVLHAPQEGDVVKIEPVDNPFFKQHWYGFGRVKRAGMLPPTNGLAEKDSPVAGDYTTFDITRGEPKAAAIDRYLASCGGQAVRSPQLDEALPGETVGQIYIRMGRKYGLNPAYAAAFFTKESSCGTAGDNLSAHNFGNIIWTPGYPRYPAQGSIAGHSWRSYLTWTDGMEDWFRLIKFEYIARGLHNIDQIVAVYAPSSENNTSLYTEQVIRYVKRIMQDS